MKAFLIHRYEENKSFIKLANLVQAGTLTKVDLMNLVRDTKAMKTAMEYGIFTDMDTYKTMLESILQNLNGSNFNNVSEPLYRNEISIGTLETAAEMLIYILKHHDSYIG